MDGYTLVARHITKHAHEKKTILTIAGYSPNDNSWEK